MNPPVPAINGEPYYDGMENIEGGSEEAAACCRSAMYGSVLSGGLGGHIYGAGGWNGGIWSGEVEAASKSPMWEAFQWPSGDQMRHLKTFILSEGRQYQELVPCTDRISPNQSAGRKIALGWAFGAGALNQDFFLLYFEMDCPQATVLGARPNAEYTARWFNPRNGEWIVADAPFVTDASGRMVLPPFPNRITKSDADWALKLVLNRLSASR